MKTELGRFLPLLQRSLMNDATKLVGMLLKDLKKSRGLSLRAFLIVSSVYLEFLFWNWISEPAELINAMNSSMSN